MADGTLKLKVSEPPEGGRANRAVVTLLAAALGVRERAVHVVRGQGSRVKLIEVDGLDERDVRSRITAALDAGRGAGMSAPARDGGEASDGE